MRNAQLAHVPQRRPSAFDYWPTYLGDERCELAANGEETARARTRRSN